MTTDTLRNLPSGTAKRLCDMIDIRPGCVVSMALTRSDACSLTLFAFDRTESVSEESYSGDTMYLVLEGEMPLTTDGSSTVLKAGDCISVPAGRLHAIGGNTAFKLLQLTVNK